MHLMSKPRGGFRVRLVQPFLRTWRWTSLPWMSSTRSEIQPRKKTSDSACVSALFQKCCMLTALKLANTSYPLWCWNFADDDEGGPSASPVPTRNNTRARECGATWMHFSIPASGNFYVGQRHRAQPAVHLLSHCCPVMWSGSGIFKN